MDIQNYIDMLGEIPEFLRKYLELNSLKRLQKVGYFCGMDYASVNVYNFGCYISRFHHSLTTALLTWRFTNSKKATLAALFHDIATPCFSHVIDYMNEDYEVQESTELKTEEILMNDVKLRSLLKEDRIRIQDISDFKQYKIVDNERPKLCADRLDGIILTSFGWTKALGLEDVQKIIDDVEVFKNEEGEEELCFKSREVAKKIVILNDLINSECHSNYDTYMMMLLARLTREAIDEKAITYDDLYMFNENEIMNIFRKLASKNDKFQQDLEIFETIKMEDIPNISLPNIKNRIIKPLVAGVRYGE
ncbi:MAG: HD domain-containing protein [Bacilli bacterium]|nr:HD domain-containing protein [Bacilli bacterium]